MLNVIANFLRKVLPESVKKRLRNFINRTFLASFIKKNNYKRDKTIVALLAEFNKVPIHRYGSFTPGVKEWEEKWDRSKGKRVLMFAYKDYAGSMYKWAEAVNKYSDYAVRLVAFLEHQYDYDYDLLMPFPHVLPRSDVQSIINESDIIHLKDENTFYFKTNELPKDIFKRFQGPMIFTAYGSYFRRYAIDESYKEYVLGFDARVAMTPDLIFPWFDGKYIPQAIDTEKYEYCWSNGQVLAHSPSTSARKGTDDLIKALEGRTDISLDLIKGLPHKECVERKKSATLFFDQAGEVDFRGVTSVVGYYGNSALEAAVFGVPTIAHISERAFEGAIIGGRDIRSISAILNTERGTEGLKRVISEFFKLSAEERKEVSLRTRRWIEDFHSYPACALELSKVYDGLLKF